MATTIKKGDIITAQNVKTGTAKQGEYFMCRVGEKANDRITIWANDGFTCPEGAKVRVVEILEFRRSNRKYNDQWYPDISAVCKLELVGEQQKFSGFEDISDDDEKLPF